MHSVCRPILLVLLVPIINLLIKNARKDKPQIKGSYATKDSRPNRSNNHMGRSNKRQGGNNNVPRVQQPVVEVQKPTYVEIGETINVKDFANLLKT